MIKTSISTPQENGVTVSIRLDKRTKNTEEKYFLAVCFTINRQRVYRHLYDFPKMSQKEFSDILETKSSRSERKATLQKLQEILEDYRCRLKEESQKVVVNYDMLRKRFSDKGGVDVSSGETSFVGIWEEIIINRRNEGRVATAQSYNCALNSFKLIIGNPPGFVIDKNVIQQWNDGMKNGVIVNGELVGKIADATRGIYLRTCRVVWHEAMRKGFLTNVEYPFSNKDNSLISIPRGKRRQQSYLSVEEMTELYKVFINKTYPDTWDIVYKERVHDSLGLFLAQYLCNGFNLADAARLRYNATYWKEGGKAFEFQRKKTSAQSNDNAVVIVPIIEPLQKILDEIAAPPSKGGYVFPQVFNGVRDEEERRRLTLKENCNIKDRVRRVCKEILGWERELVSGTWARHSFATNLKLAGVEEEYIAESMGHSHGNDVTRGYQDMYPLEIKHRNNLKLLRLDVAPEDELIDNLSPEQMKTALRYYMKLYENQKKDKKNLEK